VPSPTTTSSGSVDCTASEGGASSTTPLKALTFTLSTEVVTLRPGAAPEHVPASATAAPFAEPPGRTRPGQAARAAFEQRPDAAEIRAGAQRLLGDILTKDGLAPLVSLRLRRGLSQAELAEQVGMPASQLSRLENGHQSDVMLSTLERLAAALGVTVGQVADALAGTLGRRSADSREEARR
jgi:DNA-binding Xre family transcriptional regulator